MVQLQLGSGNTSLGNESVATGGVGSVTVTGAGSVWSNSSWLFVGDVGSSNQLTITNGGKV